MQSVRSALVIGKVTLLEAVRNRVLMAALFFAVALIGLSVSAAAVSMGERARLIVDVGLAAASAMGALIAVALAIVTVGRELERHTAYPVLVRPVPRWAFVLGKYLGVLATMLVVVTAMVLSTALAAWMYGDAVPRAFWASLYLVCLEMVVVVAVGTLFSCFTSPVLAALYSGGMLLAGNLVGDIAVVANKLEQSDAISAGALRLAYHLLPDLERLSLRVQAANDLPVPPDFLLWASLYALTYAAAALLVAMALFSRRRVV